MMNLLLVEDDMTLGETLQDRLIKEGYKVTLCQNLKEARHQFEEKAFSLVILDVGLPDGSGFDFARWVRKKTAVPFLFVTAQSSAEDRLKGYELGAEEFIPKPFHLREFLLRVQHVLANHVNSQPIVFGGIQMDFSAMTLSCSGQTHSLNLKENLVLKMLVERSPQVVSRDELLDNVWGEDEFPSNRTIDNIVVKLRNLLGPQADQIMSVRGVGYKWKGQNDVE